MLDRVCALFDGWLVKVFSFIALRPVQSDLSFTGEMGGCLYLVT